MKVLTINVHGWIEDEPYKKLRQLAKTIAKNDYEIIGLQEVNQPIHNHHIFPANFIQSANEIHQISLKEENYTAVLIQELERLGKKYFWSWSANHIGYNKYDEGLSILSKNPQESEAIIVSDSTDYDSIATRNVLKSKLFIDDDEWIIFNGHFSWWEDPNNNLIFKNEWNKISKHFEGIEKNKILFMGDFNNEAGISGEGYDYVIKNTPFLNDSYQVAEKRYGKATMAAGIDGWEDTSAGKRIDYIFVSKGITIKESNVIFDGHNEPIVSDHFGVEIIL